MHPGGRIALLTRFTAEFAVIVLGVLVALFMESAWEDRQERELAGEYLERLKDEAGLNRVEMEFDKRFAGINCSASQIAYRGLSGTTPLPAEALLRSVWAASLNRVSNYRASTYEDLVASGRLGLIRDAELRDRILGYYENDIDTWRPSRDADFRRTVFRRLPPDWTTAMVEVCADVNEMRADWESCWVPVQGGAERWVDELVSVPGFAEQLADRTYSACNFPRFIAEADSVLRELERSLGLATGSSGGE